MKKVIFYIFIILFFIGSLSAVSSANVTDDVVNNIDESISLSDLKDSTHLSDMKNEELSDEDVVNDEDILGQQQQQQQQPEPIVLNESSNKLVVEKFWEGNFSGNVSYIEIQLLHRNYDNNIIKPPKWKSTPNSIFNETVGTVVVLEINGQYIPYTIVQTAIITKDNGWKYVFTNLNFTSAKRDTDVNGNSYIYLSDSEEYIIREINVQDNVEVISQVFDKSTNLDNGFQVYWNLTNKIIQKHNNTHNVVSKTENNSRNETNENATSINEPGPSESSDDVPDEEKKNPNVPEETTTEKENNNKPSESHLNTQMATGNPIFVLLIVMFLSCIPIFRRKL